MASTLREIGFKLGYDLDKKSVSNVENSIKSIKSKATRALGALGIGFSVKSLVSMAEQFNGINDKINYAVKGLAEQKKSQQAILKVANDTKTSYAGMAESVTKLMQTNAKLFPLEDAAEFAATVQKIELTAGKSEQEASSLQSLLARTFQSEKVSLGTLSMLQTRAPEVFNVIASGLGKSTDRLLAMAKASTLSGKQIKEAMHKATEEVNRDFGNLNYSISDASLHIKNSWGYFLDDFNSTFKITENIAKGVTRLSDKLITFANKGRNALDRMMVNFGGADNFYKVFQGIFSGFTKSITPIIQNIGKTVLSVFRGITKVLAPKISPVLDDLANGKKINPKRWEEFGEAIGKLAAKFLTLKVSIDVAKKGLGIASSLGDIIAKFSGGKQGSGGSSGGGLIASLFSVLFTKGGNANAVLGDTAKAAAKVGTAGASAVSAVTSAVGKVGSAGSTAASALTEAASVTTATMEGLGAVAGASQAAVKGVGTAAVVSTGAASTMVSTLLPVVGILAAVGGAVYAIYKNWDNVSGAVNGFSDRAQAAYDSFASKVNSRFAIQKNAKGTGFSADTFIAGENGPELITNARGSKVFSAFETGRIADAVTMLSRNARVSPSSVMKTTNTRTVNQHNEFHNTFNGDLAGQKKAGKAMTRNTSDAIGEMSRALAYAR